MARADEYGYAVHSDCYARAIAASTTETAGDEGPEEPLTAA
jgi:hypothetical protein